MPEISREPLSEADFVSFIHSTLDEHEGEVNPHVKFSSNCVYLVKLLFSTTNVFCVVLIMINFRYFQMNNVVV